MFNTGRGNPEFTNSEGKSARAILERSIVQRQPRQNHFFNDSPAPIDGLAPRSENFLLDAQSDSVIVKLMPFFERVTLDADEYLYRPGDEVNYLYFPETAVFSEFQFLEDGRTIEIAMTGKEGLAGFMPFLSAAPANNWMQTSIAGSCLKISAEIFRREFNFHSRLQATLFDYLNSYVRQVSQRLICNTYHSVEQRFCGWLKMIALRCKRFNLPLTQEQIARSLGTHRPTVTGIAKNLQRENIIDYCRGRISILDFQKLDQRACDCHRQVDVQFATKAKAAGV